MFTVLLEWLPVSRGCKDFQQRWRFERRIPDHRASKSRRIVPASI